MSESGPGFTTSTSTGQLTELAMKQRSWAPWWRRSTMSLVDLALELDPGTQRRPA